MIKFGDKFGERYFLGSKAYKEDFIKGLDGCASLSCYTSFVNLCESLPLTSSDREMCLTVLGAVYGVNPNWFIIPTSSSGKYHGGVNGPQNLCGGIYNHVTIMCHIANSVLTRYKEVIDNLVCTFDMASKLLACCVLHDIGRLAFNQGAVFTVSDHGEVGAAFISSLGFSEEALLYAIGNHMYGWKAINVFNHIVSSGASVELVLLLMLCECDFFGSNS